MRALRRFADETRLVELPDPEPGPGEVLVAIDLVGICRTDLYAAAGRLPVRAPVTLGHELTGLVTAVGEGVEGLSPGDRVTAEPLRPCGACAVCRAGPEPAGRVTDCLTPCMIGLAVDGAFAEQARLPASLLHKVPPGLTPERAAFVEPLAAAMAVLDAGIDPNRPGLVYGAGRIAELTARVLESARTDPAAALHRGRGDDLAPATLEWIVETEATTASIQACIALLRPGGRLILKSRPHSPVELDTRLLAQRRLSLVGAHYGRFDQAIAAISEGHIPVDDLLGPRHALDDWRELFPRLERDEQVKHFFAPAAR